MPKYRVLRGLHAQYVGRPDEGGRRQQKIYKPGDTFESDNPDILKHNSSQGTPKFEMVKDGNWVSEDPAPSDVDSDQLQRLKVPQLKEIAEAEGVDLSGANTKSEIVDAIVEHRYASAGPDGE